MRVAVVIAGLVLVSPRPGVRPLRLRASIRHLHPVGRAADWAGAQRRGLWFGASSRHRGADETWLPWRPPVCGHRPGTP